MRKSFFASLSELALSSRSEGQKRLQQKAGRTLKSASAIAFQKTKRIFTQLFFLVRLTAEAFTAKNFLLCERP
jgi:hypothetical protein